MRAPAKINIFLKIVGTRGAYHELVSRFIRYDALFDEIIFTQKKCKEFTIEGTEIPKEHNIIYKAYKALQEYTKNPKLEKFFASHSITIKKNIPLGAGLGGGSSDCATFLQMANEQIGLGLSQEELMQLGARLGADVPFFLCGFPAANVEGIGEKIEYFEDEIPPLALKLLPIHCDTAKVYGHFRRHLGGFDTKLAQKLKTMTSKEILYQFQPLVANDLFPSAIALCPKLKSYSKDWFLSGSGSTLFRPKEQE